MKIIEISGGFFNPEKITAAYASDEENKITIFGDGLPSGGLVLDYPNKYSRDTAYRYLLNTIKK